MHRAKPPAPHIGATRVSAPAAVAGLAVFLVFLLSVCSGAALAQDTAAPETPQNVWTPVLPDTDNGPQRFLAVDKSSQRFYLLERHSPLQVAMVTPCATGKQIGDKFVEGDERTPEGVYFVRRKLTKGLDYALYGDTAYTLNFPNPVDRIKGKTGYGIWIHGRGQAITPRETRGCVALNNPDIHALNGKLSRGMPVIIAKQVHLPADAPEASQAFAQEAELLTGRVRAWTRAWSEESDEFFGFYHPERYSQSEGRPFSSFARRKRSLFSRYDWIRVEPLSIAVLPGPDYRVTTFDQLFMAPGVLSLTSKRLYWQQTDNGDYRIVGKEYAPATPDLKARFLDVLRPEVSAAIDAWRDAWLSADLDAYAEQYADNAVQQGRSGRRAIVSHKRKLWSDAPPAEVELSPAELSLTSNGIVASFEQRYQSAAGYGDTGRKTLLLVPQGRSWTIAEESWSPIR